MRLLFCVLFAACSHDALPAPAGDLGADLGGCGQHGSPCCGTSCAAGLICQQQQMCWPCYSCNGDPTCGCCGSAGQECCLSIGAHLACRTGLTCMQDGTLMGTCR
jgi:hypothetical protein